MVSRSVVSRVTYHVQTRFINHVNKPVPRTCIIPCLSESGQVTKILEFESLGYFYPHRVKSYCIVCLMFKMYNAFMKFLSIVLYRKFFRDVLYNFA